MDDKRDYYIKTISAMLPAIHDERRLQQIYRLVEYYWRTTGVIEKERADIGK